MSYIDKHNAMEGVYLQYKLGNEAERKGIKDVWRQTVTALPLQAKNQEEAQHAIETLMLAGELFAYAETLERQENQQFTLVMQDYFTMAAPATTQFKNEASLTCGLRREKEPVTSEGIAAEQNSHYIITNAALYYFDKTKNATETVLALPADQADPTFATKQEKLVAMHGLLADEQQLAELTLQQRRIITHHTNHTAISHGRDLAYLNDYFEIRIPNIRLKKHPKDISDQVWLDFRVAQKAHLEKTGKIKYTAQGEFDKPNSTYMFADDFELPPVDSFVFHFRAQGMGAYPENEAVDRQRSNQLGQYKVAFDRGLITSPGGGMVAIQEGSAEEAEKIEQMLKEGLQEEEGFLAKADADPETGQHHLDKLDIDAVKNGLLAQRPSKKPGEKPKDSIIDEFGDKVIAAVPSANAFIDGLKASIRSGTSGGKVVLGLVDSIDEFMKTPAIAASNDAIKALLSLKADVQVEMYALTDSYKEDLEYLKGHHKRVMIKQIRDTRRFAGAQKASTYYPDYDLADWFNQPNKLPGALKLADDLAGSTYRFRTLLQLIARIFHIRFDHPAIFAGETEEKMRRGKWQFERFWNDDEFNLARIILSAENRIVMPLRKLLVKIDEQPGTELTKLLETFVYMVAKARLYSTLAPEALAQMLLKLEIALVHHVDKEIPNTLNPMIEQVKTSLIQSGLMDGQAEERSQAVPKGSAQAAAEHGLHKKPSTSQMSAVDAASLVPNTVVEEIEEEKRDEQMRVIV